MTSALLAQKYSDIRSFSEALCSPLNNEDYVIQTMPDVSPTKWHLAHTTWFFETFILKPNNPNFKEHHPQYNYIFNSYYNAIGSRHARNERGHLSRPTVEEIYGYRKAIDEQMLVFLEQQKEDKKEILSLIELGLHHEQQHQELLLTDIKHVFSMNPLFPTYQKIKPSTKQDLDELAYKVYEGGLMWFGHEGEGFGYDNEFPYHQQYVNPFRFASRLITNGEYLNFIQDRGYERPELWLSDGWDLVQTEGWKAPQYWEQQEGVWKQFSLNGNNPLNLKEPTSHVSFYEAEAYARWAGKRLPTEEEWERVSKDSVIEGNFVESKQFSPVPLKGQQREIKQLFGDVWEWTSSPYVGYPGFKPSIGAVGEYNGKFMSNQMVLRGGSCATSQNHIRATYRNFFYPHQRWQFMGIRLAETV